jgi:hypothetical protein
MNDGNTIRHIGSLVVHVSIFSGHTKSFNLFCKLSQYVAFERIGGNRYPCSEIETCFVSYLEIRNGISKDEFQKVFASLSTFVVSVLTPIQEAGSICSGSCAACFAAFGVSTLAVLGVCTLTFFSLGALVCLGI